MQLTGEIAVEAIEREERQVGEQFANAFIAGAIYARWVGAEDIESGITDDTGRDCSPLVTLIW